jgi:L-cysteate sulfo-lyase
MPTLDLARFPRLPLLTQPTPIEPLDGLTRHLGDTLNGVRIFVKRDDVAGIGLGGNKLRKLEYLLGAARAEGADTVVTVGAIQSNQDPDYTGNGNRLLDDVFGATVHELPGDADSLAAAEARAAELRGQGRRVYTFPSGGSSPTGCLGYANCAAEILSQADQLGLSFTQIITANGSAGTHAGLVAGLAAMGLDTTLAKSFAVLAEDGRARAEVLEKANATLALIGSERHVSPQDINLDGTHRGSGYGIPTDGMLEAVRLMARTEGKLLDPVYSGKAFAGLLHDVRAGLYPAGSSVLFLMTGGTPGLFAYKEALAG